MCWSKQYMDAYAPVVSWYTDRIMLIITLIHYLNTQYVYLFNTFYQGGISNVNSVLKYLISIQNTEEIQLYSQLTGSKQLGSLNGRGRFGNIYRGPNVFVRLFVISKRL